jgi:hypothetical protein
VRISLAPWIFFSYILGGFLSSFLSSTLKNAFLPLVSSF